MSQQIKLLDYPIFTKQLGIDYFEENQLNNQTTQYKKDVFPANKVFAGTQGIYFIGTYTGQSDISGLQQNPATIQGSLVKTDYLGNVQWAKTIGNNTSNTYIYQVDLVEAAGDYQGIYICGKYSSNSSSQYSNILLKDVADKQAGFIARYTLAGEFIQSYVIEPADLQTQITCLSVSAQGIFFGAMIKRTNAIYIINASNEITLVNDAIVSRDGDYYDIFIGGINSLGALIFQKTLTADVENDHYIRDIDSRPDGLYIAYELHIPTPTLRFLNTYLEKYDYSATSQWIKTINSSANDYGYGMLATNSSIIMVGIQSVSAAFQILEDQTGSANIGTGITGSTDIVAVFGGSAVNTDDFSNINSQSNDGSVGGGQGFIVSRNLNGTLQWVKLIVIRTSATGSTNTSNESVVNITTNGNSIYVVGEIQSANAGNILCEYIGFSGGVRRYNDLITIPATTSGTAAYILKYDMSGTFIKGQIIDNPNNDKVYSVASSNNNLILYRSIATSDTTNASLLTAYNDPEELPLFIIASNGTQLGAVNLTIVCKNDLPYQLRINNTTTIDLSGRTSTYVHTTALTELNTYSITQEPNIESTITFQPMQLTIASEQGTALGTIKLTITSHTAATFNATYDIYKYTAALPAPIQVATDISSIEYIDGVSQDVSYNYYIVATSAGGVQYTSNTTLVRPKIPSFSLSQETTQVGQILIDIQNYEAIYKLYRINVPTNTTTLIATSTATQILDVSAGSGLQKYYIVVENIFGGNTYTSEELSITPKLPTLFGTPGNVIGQTILYPNIYNTTYNIYRQFNGTTALIASNVNGATTIYTDSVAQDGQNVYYVSVSNGTANFASNTYAITPIQLRIDPIEKHINTYKYECKNFNGSYTLYDATANKQINTYSAATFNITTHPINFYATTTTPGGKIFTSNIINLNEGYAPLLPRYSHSFAQITATGATPISNKKVCISGEHVYSCGSYTGTTSITDLTTASISTGFIYVSDFSGNILSAIAIGNAEYPTYINQIAVQNNMIFICGTYQKTESTAFTNALLPNSPTAPAGFVAAYDLSLNFLWSIAIKSSGAAETAAITASPTEVFIASNIIPTNLTIESLTGTLYSSSATTSSQKHICIYRLTHSGQWITQTPRIIAPQGFADNSISDIQFNQDNLYAIYQLSTTDAGLDTYNECMSASTYATTWSKTIVSSGDDVALSMAVNGSSVFIAGYASGTISPENDTYGVFNSNVLNVSFITKRNKLSGELEWVKKINSTNRPNGDEVLSTPEYISSIYATDAELYVIGYCTGYLYEWYQESFFVSTRRLITAELNSDTAFILKYSTTGNFLYGTQYDTPSNEVAYNIYANEGHVSLIYSTTNQGTYYGLYKESDPVSISITDGPVLGTIDILIGSEYGFNYKIYINNSSTPIDISNQFQLYNYMYAINGVNTIYILCVSNDRNILTYSLTFTPRNIDFTLDNYIKERVLLTPTLHGAASYSIERGTLPTSLTTSYENKTDPQIDQVAFNQLYYYRISARAPYSNELYYSSIKSILTSESLTIQTPTIINVATNMFNDGRTHATYITNRKLYMSEDSIYVIGQGDLSSSPSSTMLGFLAKTDFAGQVLSAINIGNDISSTTLHQLAVMPIGDYAGIYICGSYISTADATYTNIKLVNTNSRRAGFVAKYSLSGQFIWAYSLTSATNVAEITTIAITNAGLYFGANIRGACTISKADSIGSISVIETNINSITTSSSTLITRRITDTIQNHFKIALSPPSIISTTNYMRDMRAASDGIYLLYDIGEAGSSLNTLTAKYSYAGQLQWVKRIATADDEYGYAIAETPSTMIAGGARSFFTAQAATAETDIAPLFSSQITQGTAFLISRAKADGSLSWAKQINIINSDNTNYMTREPIYSIASINTSIYVCGQLLVSPNIKTLSIQESTLAAGQISTATIYTFTQDTSGTIGFIAKYSTAGAFKWIKIIDNAGTDFLTSVAANNGYLAALNIRGTNPSANELIIFRDMEETFYNYNTGPSPPLIIPPPPTTPGAIPCIVRGALVKTARGEIPIETLQQTDTIIDPKGRKIPVKAIYKTRIIATEKTAPYKIPAKLFGAHPIKDLYLSPKHAFQSAPGIWQIPEFTTNSKIKKAMIGQEVQYYHVELPNYFTDNLVVNGTAVESFAATQIDLTTCLYKYIKDKKGFIRSKPQNPLPHSP